MRNHKKLNIGNLIDKKLLQMSVNPITTDYKLYIDQDGNEVAFVG